uniref:SAM domain-containing protein n=1 Tax=Electrophorus electricus TaxID=8005 RepID=A0A4W4FWR2_ELEEL
MVYGCKHVGRLFSTSRPFFCFSVCVCLLFSEAETFDKTPSNKHNAFVATESLIFSCSHLLELKLKTAEIFGSKAVTELTNGLCELGSPIDVGSLQALQLAEELRLALELQEDGDRGREALRSRLPCSTSHALLEWLERGTVSSQSPSNNETHQERLERLEGDKESLVLQVSVLTEQVEAQGEKIRDLEASLEENSDKLLSTEEMLQQELLSRTSLETQKLDLMDEVSCLKLKLVSMEEEQDPAHRDDKQRKAEALLQELRVLKTKVDELESEKLQYDRTLKATKLQRLKAGIASLLTANNEKNHVVVRACKTPVPYMHVHCVRIKRTQSGSFRADSLPHGDFKRRGVRSTTGPSVAHMGDTAHDVNTPFSKWSCDQVCVWLEDYGLGQYIPMAKQWVSSGQTLLSASPHDFEKELGIKHPLHRKKLQLGLHAISSASSETSAKLDHVWVTRWLDDIGLPQYKDQFHEARVDGRMLQYLTVDDLLLLKVSSQLHHLSIKCAIRVLHANKFNPNCLKRRPGEESQPSPSEVMQWSNHRVMEWLRAVDLAEYAPNLRGSGVHGGLIILEQSFNEESLAVLLSIPPQKTLLRRHLATNFHSLVGAQAQRDKVHFLESPGYAPLSTTAKVRPKKLGFSGFSHLRKKRPDDSTDYVCPLEPLQDESLRNGTRQPRTDLGPVQDGDTEGREQVGPPLC